MTQKDLLKKEKLLLRYILKTKLIQFVYKKITDEDYVIWVKMIDLQTYLHHRNLCNVAMKKIKSYCGTKNPSKEQVKNIRRNGSMD